MSNNYDLTVESDSDSVTQVSIRSDVGLMIDLDTLTTNFLSVLELKSKTVSIIHCNYQNS
jgi:hypothetical protein